MRLSRPVVALAGAGLLGLAAVGAGAGATFTTDTQSSQTVSAGTLHVSVEAGEGATCTDVRDYGCHTLKLADVGPVGSTFETHPTVVTIRNTGHIPAFFSAIQMSESHNLADSASNAFANQMNVCIKSTDPSGTWVEGNGPLSAAVALNPTVQENPVELAPGETATYQMNFYAGKDSECGTTYSDGSHTRDRWAGYLGGGYHTPASLTNDAQGGVVTPTLTFKFTG